MNITLAYSYLREFFAELINGFVSTAQLGSGTADSTTFLRGDSTWAIPAGTYNDEQAQDAVGTILTDTSTVDFTYDDGIPTISAIVPNDAITYAKMQNVSAASRLLGRGSAAGAGDPEEMTVGASLSIIGTVINVVEGSIDHGNLLGLGDDDHTQYQLRSEQGIPDGYPDLDALGFVPTDQLGGSGAGATKFLRGDQNWAVPGGAGASMTVVEKDLGSTPKTFGKFTVSDGTVSTSSKILIIQAPGPYTGKGTREDEAEMDDFKLTVTSTGTGTFTVAWKSSQFAVPVFKERVSANNNAQLLAQNANFSRDTAPFIIGMQMLGKVRGNVKFGYMVLS